MHLTVDSSNTKTLHTLLAEQEISIPRSCQGRGICGQCMVTVTIHGETTRKLACQFIPKESLEVAIENHPSSAIQAISSYDEDLIAQGITQNGWQTPGYSLLLDLGTTTLAFYLVNSMGQNMFTSTIANPQIRYGSDVLARITASVAGKKKELQSLIHAGIASEIAKIVNQLHINIDEICYGLIGGNTTMMHLLYGLDCKSLGVFPFLPAQTEFAPISIGGIKFHTVPCISAFIGGDILSGMYGLEWENKTGSLLLDLGTNGEMVLGTPTGFIAASAAAGPAFEGGNLCCGLAAIPGAITQVDLSRMNPVTSTIDNKLPTGICGSGALSIMDEIYNHHLASKDGILTEDFIEQGITLANLPGHKIIFTAEDFRQMQLAIASIHASLDTLCQEGPCTELYLGGGFGFYLDLPTAFSLHLLPGGFRGHVHVVGNSNLAGLMKFAQNQITDFTILNSYIESTKVLSLSEHPYYREAFIGSMSLT